MIAASSHSITYYLEDGKKVYPCRCGETHRGDYAAYDYGHHNCLHESPLIRLDILGDIQQVMCPDCGNIWDLE